MCAKLSRATIVVPPKPVKPTLGAHAMYQAAEDAAKLDGVTKVLIVDDKSQVLCCCAHDTSCAFALVLSLWWQYCCCCHYYSRMTHDSPPPSHYDCHHFRLIQLLRHLHQSFNLCTIQPSSLIFWRHLHRFVCACNTW
jgi:hypothetical protein